MSGGKRLKEYFESSPPYFNCGVEAYFNVIVVPFPPAAARVTLLLLLLRAPLRIRRRDSGACGDIPPSCARLGGRGQNTREHILALSVTTKPWSRQCDKVHCRRSSSSPAA